MCNMAVYYGVMAVATAFSVYSTVEQKNQADGVAKYNAAAEVDKAAEARRAGAIANADHMRKVRHLIGTQIAAGGASGADVFSGSSENTLDETMRLGLDDASRISYNAELAALGHEGAAQSLRMQSGLDQSAYNGRIGQGLGQIAGYSTQAWLAGKK